MTLIKHYQLPKPWLCKNELRKLLVSLHKIENWIMHLMHQGFGSIVNLDIAFFESTK